MNSQSHDERGDNRLSDHPPASGIRSVASRQSEVDGEVAFCEPLLIEEEAEPKSWRVADLSRQVDDILGSESASAEAAGRPADRRGLSQRIGLASLLGVVTVVAMITAALAVFFL